MSFDNNVHILGLNPLEQFLVKLVLSNLMAGYLDKAIQDAPGIDNDDAVRSKATAVLNFFEKYNSFTDMLCPESMLGKGKPKVLMIKPGMMKYVVMAFNGYMANNNYLSHEHRQMLDRQFPSLKKRVLESSGYTYNRIEIEKAKNS
jgi:hypothetical protein